MTTVVEPVVVCLADVEATPPPQCQALLQCADECCEPFPCTRPATARVTFPCSTPGCGCAYRVLLLCSDCASQAAAAAPDVTRRPL